VTTEEQVTEHHRYKCTIVPIPCVDVAGFQCPLLTPVQHAPNNNNNNNRGMIELELGAAQKQHHHHSASEAILIYNQQLHADQSANAIAGETSSSADGALTGSDGRCGPHSVELSTGASQPCAEARVLVCAGGCARYARSRKLSLSLLHACNKRTYGRPLELGQRSARGRGNSNGM
jgi:hypothetical protein